MPKSKVFEQEKTKLTEIFADVEDSKRRIVEGLIEDAAFIKAENYELRKHMSETGMVLIHPNNPKMQKPVESARQYLKNVNSYSVIIKTLNGVLDKNVIEDDDDMSEWE